MVLANVSIRHHEESFREVGMVIVGGGICGILAAKMCHDRKLSYCLVEREAVLGGNWFTLANARSSLQVGSVC